MKRVVRTMALGMSLAAGLSWSTLGSAQGNAPAAEALFEQARQELAAGKVDAACDKFRQSDQLDPAVGTKLNLASCEEQRGRLATAWELYRAAEAALGPEDQRLGYARQKRQALEPRLPKLKLRLAAGAPPDTTVRTGDAELKASAFGVPLPMDPGERQLSVIAPGREPKSFTVRLGEGKTTELEVGPGAAKPPVQSATSAPPRSTVPPDSARPSGGKRTLGFVLGGVGVAALVAGGVTGVMALGKKSEADKHCNDALRVCDQTGLDANDSGRMLGTVTTAAWAVGVVGVGLGTYFILSSSPRSETALVTTSRPGGAELSLVRHW